MQIKTLFLSLLLLSMVYLPSAALGSVTTNNCEHTTITFRNDLSEGYCFTVILSSGTIVSSIAYFPSQEKSLRGKWDLTIENDINMVAQPHQDIHKNSLSENEFRELIDQLLGVIGKKYGGKIAHISLRLDFVEPILEDMVKFFRDTIADRHLVQVGKDIVFIRAARVFFERDRNITYICNKLKDIGRTCEKYATELETLLFKSQYHKKTWREVKATPDAGLDKKKTWYVISLDELMPTTQ
ncbi:MAG: hypothetical protein LBU11_00760 [Zoogloeaceae bacterium]|jgi:hypothetical protein|nr:hypothetical protein [Zoogloeaceae bacterium]